MSGTLKELRAHLVAAKTALSAGNLAAARESCKSALGVDDESYEGWTFDKSKGKYVKIAQETPRARARVLLWPSASGTTTRRRGRASRRPRRRRGRTRCLPPALGALLRMPVDDRSVTRDKKARWHAARSAVPALPPPRASGRRAPTPGPNCRGDHPNGELCARRVRRRGAPSERRLEPEDGRRSARRSVVDAADTHTRVEAAAAEALDVGDEPCRRGIDQIRSRRVRTTRGPTRSNGRSERTLTAATFKRVGP